MTRVTEGDREIVPLGWTSNGKCPSTKWAERALSYVVAFGRRAETRPRFDFCTAWPRMTCNAEITRNGCWKYGHRFWMAMTNAWTRVRWHFSLRQRFIWRIRLRWKQQDLATEEMWSLVSHWQCVVEISKIAHHVWVWIKGRDKGYEYKVWTATSQQQEVNNQPLVILSF